MFISFTNTSQCSLSQSQQQQKGVIDEIPDNYTATCNLLPLCLFQFFTVYFK